MTSRTLGITGTLTALLVVAAITPANRQPGGGGDFDIGTGVEEDEEQCPGCFSVHTPEELPQGRLIKMFCGIDTETGLDVECPVGELTAKAQSHTIIPGCEFSGSATAYSASVATKFLYRGCNPTAGGCYEVFKGDFVTVTHWRAETPC